MNNLEAARHDAIRLLCAAQAKELLPLDAFESRLERLKQAPNIATMDAIVADLHEVSGSFTSSALAPAVTGHTSLAGAPVAPAEQLRVASVLASTKRGGSWTVPLELQLYVLLGELTIDLRDAVFGSDVLDIDLTVKLGQLALIVPAGAQVENEVHEVLSSSTHSTRGARGASPIGLLIRLRGSVLLGSIEVKEKPPSALAPPREGVWEKLLGAGE